MHPSTMNFDITKETDWIYTEAYKLTRHKQDAEDLAQTTIYKALLYQNSYLPGTNLQGWIYTILKNTFITFKRKQRETGELYDNCAKQSQDAEFILEYKNVSSVINQLNPVLQETFKLYISGYKPREISKLQQINNNTVRSRIFNVIRKLEKHFAA